jgi:hypothetical protein
LPTEAPQCTALEKLAILIVIAAATRAGEAQEAKYASKVQVQRYLHHILNPAPITQNPLILSITTVIGLALV